MRPWPDRGDAANDGPRPRRERSWAIATGFVVRERRRHCSLPGARDLVGEFVGGLVGLLFGFVIAPVATVVSRRTASVPVARLACSSTSADLRSGCACLAWPHYSVAGSNALTVGLWLGACAGLGAWFGPGVAFGFRPMRFGVAGRGTVRVGRREAIGAGDGRLLVGVGRVGLSSACSPIGRRAWSPRSAARAVRGSVLLCRSGCRCPLRAIRRQRARLGSAVDEPDQGEADRGGGGEPARGRDRGAVGAVDRGTGRSQSGADLLSLRHRDRVGRCVRPRCG